ncbi:hypothetical protein ACIBAI_22665 [Streptomyces sp. NPDC051041]|uniref:hypothetical protein n=1 Tax=Streptomyces sp. NPDC051041 TaxID=3365640 RepID=UPI0037A496A2
MRALQETREQAITPLVEILAKRSALLEELAALDASYGKAYVEAEAAGWTAGELAQLGAEEPVKRPRVRSKRSRSAARKRDGRASGTTPEGGSPTGAIPSQEGLSTTDDAMLGTASG